MDVFCAECLFFIEYWEEKKHAKITQNKVKFALDNNRNRIFIAKIIEKGAEKIL